MAGKICPPGPERDQYETDYNEWPVEDGAPFNDINNDGIYTPGIDNPYIGDETMWCVSNDLDPSRTTVFVWIDADGAGSSDPCLCI